MLIFMSFFRAFFILAIKNTITVYANDTGFSVNVVHEGPIYFEKVCEDK